MFASTARFGLIQALAPMSNINATGEAIERAVELTCCYEIWRELVNREQESVNRPVIQEYDEFFTTVIHSLLQSFAVISYQLFETRPDTVSINTLVKAIKATNPTVATKIEARIAACKPILTKVFALRNKVYAHRSDAVTPEDVFRNVGITPDEMRALVKLAQGCIAALAESSGERTESDLRDEFKSRSSWANQSTMNLMVALHQDGR